MINEVGLECKMCNEWKKEMVWVCMYVGSLAVWEFVRVFRGV